MKAKKGYPQYMQKIMNDYTKSLITGKKDPNIIFKVLKEIKNKIHILLHENYNHFNFKKKYLYYVL